ncbi:MAG TPA: MBL fold metallo-hydrolase, partial [Anaerolineales bacterium]
FSDVNCYLVKNETGYFLIDTGMTNSRHLVETELVRLGCRPGNLNLILITHGDFDHTGNAAYLRKVFASKIAMHEADAGILENGDMFWNRKIRSGLLKKVLPFFISFGKAEQCTPDILLRDGLSLAEYGLNSKVFNTPGHSSGSLCILTSTGELFCGDLLTSARQKPGLNSMMYDREAGNLSLERLKTLPIQTVYPGHGKPFQWSAM